MIKEFFEDKIYSNIGPFMNAIIAYLGADHAKELLEKTKKIKLILSKGNGVVKIGNDERYVEDEPICIKDEDVTYIILPFSIMGEVSGNVMFLHVLLHALSTDVLMEKHEELNEVLIDYIANEIGAILEKQNINITIKSEPVYSSKSFYSYLFPVIEEFYESDKKSLIESLFISGDYDVEKIEKVSNAVEIAFYDLLNKGNLLEKESKQKK